MLVGVGAAGCDCCSGCGVGNGIGGKVGLLAFGAVTCGTEGVVIMVGTLGGVLGNAGGATAAVVLGLVA